MYVCLGSRTAAGITISRCEKARMRVYQRAMQHGCCIHVSGHPCPIIVRGPVVRRQSVPRCARIYRLRHCDESRIRPKAQAQAPKVSARRACECRDEPRRTLQITLPFLLPSPPRRFTRIAARLKSLVRFFNVFSPDNARSCATPT